jgi:hypothetical protein
MEMYFQWQEQGVHTGGHFEDWSNNSN